MLVSRTQFDTRPAALVTVGKLPGGSLNSSVKVADPSRLFNVLALLLKLTVGAVLSICQSMDELVTPETLPTASVCRT